MAVYECQIRPEELAPEPIIGLLNDIHQNTLLLGKMLEAYRRIGVNVILSLGDYSFYHDPSRPGQPPQADPGIERYRQFKTVMDMLVDYIDSRPCRLVVLMGNHEVVPDYYAAGEESESRKLIEHFTNTVLKAHPAIVLHPQPFASFELDNAILVRIGHKSFLAAHAISEMFVNAVYRGIRTEAERELLAAQIGRERCEALRAAGRFERAALLWNKFLGAQHKSEKEAAIDEITENVAEALMGVAVPDRWGGLRTLNWEGLDTLGVLSDIYRYRFDYLIVGHFHADVGLNPVVYSPRMGYYWNFVVGGAAGFQPQKVLSRDHTSYIVFPFRKSQPTSAFPGWGVNIREGVEAEYVREPLDSIQVSEWDLGRTHYAEPHDSHGIALRLSSSTSYWEDPTACDLSLFREPEKQKGWTEYLRGGGLLKKEEWDRRGRR